MKALSSTKNRILEAALSLLECKGIQSLTQPAVAKSVGIPQGQLTYHFRKRTDLIMAVAEATLDKAADLFFKGKEESFLQLVIELLKSKQQARALFGLIMEADDNPDLKQRLLQQREKVRTLIAASLKVKVDHPRVTIAHSLLLGFALQLLLVDDKNTRAKIEADFLEGLKMFGKKKPKRKGENK